MHSLPRQAVERCRSVENVAPDKLMATWPQVIRTYQIRSVARVGLDRDDQDASRRSKKSLTTRALVEILRNRIVGDESVLGTEKLRPGQPFLSWADLEQTYGVSTKVAQKAAWALEDEGLITSRQGAQSSVYDPAIREPVVINGPCVVVSRMPTPDEIDEFDMPRRGMPIHVVTWPDGREEKYPSDRFRLDIRCKNGE